VEGEDMIKRGSSVKKIGFKFKYLIALLGIVIIASSLISFYASRNFGKGSSIIAWVNGEPIMLEEFDNEVEIEKKDVESYFIEKYGAMNNGVEFWSKPYDGVSPADYLRDNSLKKIETVKMQQIFAKDNGIIKQLDYQNFINEFKAGNKNIPPSLANSVVFKLAMDDLVKKTMAKLAEKYFTVSEDEIKAEYNLEKDKTYAKYTRNFQIVTIKIIDNHFMKVDALETKANEILGKIMVRFEQGDKFDDIKKDYANFTDPTVIFNEKGYDDFVVRRFESILPKLMNIIKKLNVGEVSGIIDDSDGNLVLLRCTGVNLQGAQPLEQVKKTIQVTLANKKYEVLIAKMLKDAKIEINKKGL
jgi:hypothetical protein